MFEYSQKGIPHALVHAPELVECGGHHAAYNAALVETSHKFNIKDASKYSKTYASHNETHGGMLKYCLYQRLWREVIRRNNEGQPPAPTSDLSADDEMVTSYQLSHPLPYTQGWSEIERPRVTIVWRSTFISRRVLITREELLTLLLRKLDMDTSLRNLNLLVKQLRFECFGVATLKSPDAVKRKVVGVGPASSTRRDFVRLRKGRDDDADDDAWSSQVKSMSVLFSCNSTYFYIKVCRCCFLTTLRTLIKSMSVLFSYNSTNFVNIAGTHVRSCLRVRSRIRDSCAPDTTESTIKHTHTGFVSHPLVVSSPKRHTKRRDEKTNLSCPPRH